MSKENQFNIMEVQKPQDIIFLKIFSVCAEIFWPKVMSLWTAGLTYGSCREFYVDTDELCLQNK